MGYINHSLFFWLNCSIGYAIYASSPGNSLHIICFDGKEWVSDPIITSENDYIAACEAHPSVNQLFINIYKSEYSVIFRYNEIYAHVLFIGIHKAELECNCKI